MIDSPPNPSSTTVFEKVSGVLIAIAAASMLSGCSTTSMYQMRTALGTNYPPQGPAFVSPVEVGPNEAVVYLYRNIGWAQAPDVIVNGRNIGLLSEGAFVVDRIAPGQTNIQIQRNPNMGTWEFDPIGIKVDARPGQRTYIRIGAGLGGVIITPWFGSLSYNTEIREVPESTALQELQSMRAMR